MNWMFLLLGVVVIAVVLQFLMLEGILRRNGRAAWLVLFPFIAFTILVYDYLRDVYQAASVARRDARRHRF